MILNGRFLEYKPSQIAASSLILSILSNYEFGSGTVSSDPNSLTEAEYVWNRNVEEMTGLRFSDDIKSVYC